MQDEHQQEVQDLQKQLRTAGAESEDLRRQASLTDERIKVLCSFCRKQAALAHASSP